MTVLMCVIVGDINITTQKQANIFFLVRRLIFTMDSFEKATTFIKAGYEPKKRHIKGYHLVSELSTPNGLVYESANNVVIVYPGTRWTRHHVFSDVASDVRIALGQQGDRWKEATRLARSTKHHYPKKHIHVYGHSLGGTLAMHVSDQTGLPTTVVNPGVVSSSPHDDKDYSNVTAYTNKNDPITAGTTEISDKTGITVKPLSSKHEDFWTKGGIEGYLNRHKGLKYGLEAAAAVVGAAVAVATGGAAVPEEAALLGEVTEVVASAEEVTPLLEDTAETIETVANTAEDASETTPLLQQATTVTEETTEGVSSSSTTARAIKGATTGVLTVENAESTVDKTGKAINGALNHHSANVSDDKQAKVDNQTNTIQNGNSDKPGGISSSLIPQVSQTSQSYKPTPRSDLTAYSLQGYDKVAHENIVTGASLMSVYSRRRHRKEKVRRTR